MAADVLGRLVDKSLVTPRHDRVSRWRLLETVRAFAVAELDASDDGPEVRQRHLRWATSVALALRDRFGGRWQAEFDAVAGELRHALDAAPPGPDADVHRLTGLLAHLSFARRFLVEALDRYRAAATRTTSPDEAATHLTAAAHCAWMFGDFDQAFDLFLTAARATTGNPRTVALAQAVEVAGRFFNAFRDPVPLERRTALLTDAQRGPTDQFVAARLTLAAAWTTPSTPDAALADRALAAAEATGDPALVVAALDACRVGAGPARDFVIRRLDLAQRLDPNDPAQAVERDDAMTRTSLEAAMNGDVRTARYVADRTLGDEPTYLAVNDAIPAYVLSGALDEAVGLADAMWTGWQEAGRPHGQWMWVTLPFVVLAHGLLGDQQAVTTWWARIDELTGSPGPDVSERLRPLTAYVTARIAVHTADHTDHTADTRDARALVDHVDTLTTGKFLPYARSVAAELAVVAGLPDAADILAAVTPTDHPWASAYASRAAGRLHGDPALLADSAERWEQLGAGAELAYTRRLLSGT
ncbi:hypothetical protein GCM10029964_077800 [Kibdelosporangium lantanae]